jgi:acyl dehydratase
MRVFDSAASLQEAAGDDLGHSDWMEVDQARVDLFAEATEDRQWIHVDPERAAEGPFGTTIIHGYLTLSLLVPLMKGVFRVEGHKMALNYGQNKVRFPAPAPVGSRLRAGVAVASVEDVSGGVQVVWRVAVEAEGVDKPVCVAEPVTRYYF